MVDAEPLMPYKDPIITVPEYLQDSQSSSSSEYHNNRKRVYSKSVNLGKKAFKINERLYDSKR